MIKINYIKFQRINKIFKFLYKRNIYIETHKIELIKNILMIVKKIQSSEGKKILTHKQCPSKTEKRNQYLEFVVKKFSSTK